MLETCHQCPSVSPQTVFPAHLQLLSPFRSLPLFRFCIYSLSWPFSLCLSLWQRNSFRDYKVSWVSAPLKFYWDVDALFRHLTKFRCLKLLHVDGKNIIYLNGSKVFSFLMIHLLLLRWKIPASPDSDLYIWVGLFPDSIVIKRLGTLFPKGYTVVDLIDDSWNYVYRHAPLVKAQLCSLSMDPYFNSL